MILLRGVSQVEKEPEGCTWNENLAWIVHLRKGWISWAIKMKDWVGKALRCGVVPLSLPEGSRVVGKCGPHTSVLCASMGRGCALGSRGQGHPTAAVPCLATFQAQPSLCLQLWAQRDDGTHLLNIRLSRGLIHYTSCDNYRTFHRGWRDGVQSVLVTVPLAPVLCSCREACGSIC